MSNNLVFVLSGVACLAVGWIIFYKALPRSGKPQSALVASEGGAMSVAMLLMILLFTGIALVVKGLVQ